MLRTRLSAAALAVGLVVAGCGSSGPTTPPVASQVAGSTPPSAGASSSADPSSAPVPTASPVDAAAAFEQTLGDAVLEATATFAGTSTVGKVATTWSGAAQTHISARHTVLTRTTGAKAATVETLIDGRARYVRQFKLWFRNGSADGTDLVGALLKLQGYADVGVEPKNGESLHHLTLPTGTTIPAVAVGLTGSSISNAAITVDGWSRDDGTPVYLTVSASWDQVVAKKTVKGTLALDVQLAGVGSSVSVALPDQVWTIYAKSPYRYRVAYPVDWDLTKAKNRRYSDVFYGFDGESFAAWRGSAGSLSLASLTSGLKTYLPQILTDAKNIKITSSKASRLAGVKARRIEYRATYKGKAYWSIAVFTVKGGRLYFLEFETIKKTTATNRAMMDNFLRSFSFR